MIPRLCYITDGARGTGGRPLEQVIEQAWAGGLRMVVLRERAASDLELSRLIGRLLPLRRQGLHILLSRRVDLAQRFDLDGVHLAADSMPVAEARETLGPHAWIGYSAHDAAEAQRVAKEGASYLTLSPIYPTDSKPGLPGRGAAWLAEAVEGLPIPALALGGIGLEQVAELLATGVRGVATVSSLGAAADVRATARAFLAALEQGDR